jgi:hypothetical protein
MESVLSVAENSGFGLVASLRVSGGAGAAVLSDLHFTASLVFGNRHKKTVKSVISELLFYGLNGCSSSV